MITSIALAGLASVMINTISQSNGARSGHVHMYHVLVSAT